MTAPTRCYLDTNVFYHAYCPIEDEDNADWLLNQLNQSLQGVTSEWTIVEMFRALKKQTNLGAIEETDANIVIDFFLGELGEMINRNVLQLIPVTRKLLMAAREQIFSANLHAADAVHAVTAINAGVQAFITYDSDFKADLGAIPLLSPASNSFRSDVHQLTARP